MVPQFANLKRYQIDIFLYTPRTQDGLGILNSPSTLVLEILHGVTPSELQHTPDLTTIYCPTRLDFQRSSEEIGPSIPPHDAHSFNGLTIHTYDHGNDSLVHMRSHSGIHDKCMGRDCYICPAAREDAAWYNGKRIPDHVLRTVYAAGGVDMKSLQPGEERILGHEGWEVLRYVSSISGEYDGGWSD